VGVLVSCFERWTIVKVALPEVCGCGELAHVLINLDIASIIHSCSHLIIHCKFLYKWPQLWRMLPTSTLNPIVVYLKLAAHSLHILNERSLALARQLWKVVRARLLLLPREVTRVVSCLLVVSPFGGVKATLHVVWVDQGVVSIRWTHSHLRALMYIFNGFKIGRSSYVLNLKVKLLHLFVRLP